MAASETHFLKVTGEVRTCFCCRRHDAVCNLPLNDSQREDMNQYWYSSASIQAIVGKLCAGHRTTVALCTLPNGSADEVVELDCKVAFLSTPSIYFCLPEEARAKCMVFDLSTGSALAFPDVVHAHTDHPE